MSADLTPRELGKKASAVRTQVYITLHYTADHNNFRAGLPELSLSQMFLFGDGRPAQKITQRESLADSVLRFPWTLVPQYSAERGWA